MVEIEGSGSSTSTNRLPSSQSGRIALLQTVPTFGDAQIAKQMATQL